MTAAEALRAKAEQRLARGRGDSQQPQRRLPRPRGESRRWRPSIADRLVPAAARLSREREANRRRVARLQAAEAARQRRPQREGYFSEADRGRLLLRFEGLVRRLLREAAARGLPPWAELRDLGSRLRLELAGLLAAYQPRPGVDLTGYLAAHLRRRLARAVREECADGIRDGPPRRPHTMQWSRAEHLWDWPPCGRRRRIPRYWDEPAADEDGADHERPGRGAWKAMPDWGELGRRERRLVLKLDVQRALDKLHSRERRLVRLWQAGHSQAEIAHKLGVSQQAVSVWLSGVFARLNTLLADYAPVTNSESTPYHAITEESLVKSAADRVIDGGKRYSAVKSRGIFVGA